jgi:hypothetical protein
MRKMIVLLFAFCAFAAAAEDTVGWHIVKAGETLESITRRYLGTSEGWRENWKLNPQLASPHRLLPGQRIKVILARELPARFARIDRISRHVERKPEPDPWTLAKAGDRLAERHGLQTYRASSAELRFEDDTQLTLTEESLIFLRSTKTTPKRDRTEIEVIDGLADLDKKRTQHAHDIEIIVGGVVAKPSDADARARFRKETGGGKVMSYRGATSVASAGASVDVREGMGVSVPEGQRPPKPEKLLPAPAIAAIDVAEPRPLLRWPAVAGASSYSVEICRDASCGAVIARVDGLAASEWKTPEALNAGAMHWRVTARSASGLDGYPAVAPMNVRLGISGIVRIDGKPSAGAAVLLRRSGETRTVQTNANGVFVFDGLEASRYEVAVDSRSLSNVAWPEQIDGPPGAQCGDAVLTAAGPCPGGRRRDASDDASNAATSEHVASVDVSTDPVDGIDFGFSFGAVTTTADAGQGTLRQFLLNANALPGAQAMRFFPGDAVSTIKLASPLPAITDAVTIEGTPGGAAEIGSVTRVGLRRTNLLNPKRAALKIDFNGAPVGFDAKAAFTLRNIAIGGAATQVRAASTLAVENVVIGTLLEAAPEIGIEAFAEVTLRRTLITGMHVAGIAVRRDARIEAQHLEVSNSGDAVAIEGTGSRIRNSLFYLNANAITAATSNVVEESTFRGNRTALSVAGAAPVNAGNVFEDNTLAAIRGGRVSRISVDPQGRTVVSGTAAAGADIEIFTGALQRAAAAKAGADGTFDLAFFNFPGAESAGEPE